MGMSDLPDIYARAQRTYGPRACAYIRQITHAHATTDIFHLGDTPVSVGKCRITLRVYLYWPLLTSIVVNDVRAMTDP